MINTILKMFQSSFELTGYITGNGKRADKKGLFVSKLFRAYGLYNRILECFREDEEEVSKLFRAYGLYNCY